MSDAEAMDIGSITPEQFAQLVATLPEDEVVSTIRAAGTAAVLERIFQGMPERFRPDRAGATTATVTWVVRDEGNEHGYTTHIASGACTVEPGPADDPTVRLALDLLPFVKLITGRENGPALFMRGKLQLSGDLMLASRLTTFFDTPTSG